MRGYRNQDGQRLKQKALPMTVLRKLHDIAASERDRAVAWLLTGAIFFAMRSCEYLQTAEESTKRTRIVRLRNIRFKRGQCLIPHEHPEVHKSDLVQITFEYQKNDKRDVSIHMFSSGDKLLCPVRAWAYTVRRVRKIPGADESSPVCLFFDENEQQSLLSAGYVRSRLRAVVTLLGEQMLGFTADSVGLHSIRSGGAMAMFLSGVPVVIIMRVGRWSSDAFLEYIRDQVESFTAEVSKKMIRCEDFVNLNIAHSETTPQVNDEVPTNLPLNEDGPNSVALNVQFSNLALGRGRRQQSKR